MSAAAGSTDTGQSLDTRLAALLHARGVVRPNDLARAQALQREDGGNLPALLLRLGLIAERDLANALGETLGLEVIEAQRYPSASPVDTPLPFRFLREVQAVPVAVDDDGNLTVAFANPGDQSSLQGLRLAFPELRVQPVVGLPSDINRGIQGLEQQSRDEPANDDALAITADDVSEEDVNQLRDLASEAPVVRLVNMMFQRAVELDASDIHIEPFEDQLRVRLRIDGVLHEIDAPSVRSAAAVISRVKIMARLDIAERRLPQDGRIKARVQGRELDFRVSTVPTLYGESVVMRLLDQRNVILEFETLGYTPGVLARFKELLDRPHGIILVTGPTGSGKTTTLYTALSRLNSAERKIITVEDPVEYQLDGINQIQTKSQIGLTFANALRSIVRQDPDVIMIGEMRDLETARIAVQSALTGHLVLSTLHTNDAPSSINRLLDMGVEDYLLTSTVNGILAQRLVRTLCPHCKEPHTPSAPYLEETGLARMGADTSTTLYRPVGCERCGSTGYRGRKSIVELLTMTDGLRQDVMRHAVSNELRARALQEGMVGMYDDGLIKVLDGVTTVEEITRVTQEG